MFKRAVAGILFSALAVAASPASAQCSLAKLLEIPVTLVDGRPMTTIKVNGQDAKFFVNNSVFFNMVHANAAKRLQMAPVDKFGRIEVVDASRPNANVGVTRAKTLTAPGLDLKDVDFLTDDGGRDSQVDGSLGQNLLDIGDIEFDLRGGVVRLLRATACGQTPLAYWEEAKKGYSAMSASSKNDDHFTIAKATINGQPVNVLLASGASYSFLTEAGAKRLHLTPPASALRRTGDRVWAPIATIKLGDEEIHNTQLPIAKFDLHEAAEQYDMLLGVDFLLSHHVYFAKEQNQIYFTYSGGAVFAPAPKAP